MDIGLYFRGGSTLEVCIAPGLATLIKVGNQEWAVDMKQRREEEGVGGTGRGGGPRGRCCHLYSTNKCRIQSL